MLIELSVALCLQQAGVALSLADLRFNDNDMNLPGRSSLEA